MIEQSLQVSVVIPTYNRAESLRLVLCTLLRQSLAQDLFEVIVVDDGSTDHTEQIVSEAGLRHVQYVHQTNQGEIVARATGVSLACGELLAFLDDDIYVVPDYLEALLVAHAEDDRCLITGVIHPLYCPLEADPLRLLNDYVLEQPAANREWLRYTDVCGHSFSLRREAYDEIGGMRPLGSGGRNAWGGIDLAYRAKRLGYDIYRAPRAVGIHNDYGLRDYATTARRWERVCTQAVLLLRRYPALQGQIPMLRDKEEIHWSKDGGGLIARKLVKRLWSLFPLIGLFDRLVQVSPSRWRVQMKTWGVEPHMVQGYRRGLRQFGSVCDAPVGEFCVGESGGS